MTINLTGFQNTALARSVPTSVGYLTLASFHPFIKQWFDDDRFVKLALNDNTVGVFVMLGNLLTSVQQALNGF